LKQQQCVQQGWRQQFWDFFWAGELKILDSMAGGVYCFFGVIPCLLFSYIGVIGGRNINISFHNTTQQNSTFAFLDSNFVPSCIHQSSHLAQQYNQSPPPTVDNTKHGRTKQSNESLPPDDSCSHWHQPMHPRHPLRWACRVQVRNNHHRNKIIIANFIKNNNNKNNNNVTGVVICFNLYTLSLPTSPSSRLPLLIRPFLFFILFPILFFSNPPDATDVFHFPFCFSLYSDGPSANGLANSEVDTYYPFYQDVHVMIFIGFGFLMTFLKK
jgi:hypothetical protein